MNEWAVWLRKGRLAGRADVQNVRLRRHLLGALASLIVVIVVYGYAWFGTVDPSVAHIFGALVLFGVLSFTACIATGFDLRFADPSLTIGQLMTSGAAMAYLSYAAAEFRALQLPFC